MLILIIFQNTSEFKWENRRLLQLPFSKIQFCFVNISAPLNRTKMVLYSKFANWFQFSVNENGLQFCSLVPEILSKTQSGIFLGHPVYT